MHYVAFKTCFVAAQQCDEHAKFVQRQTPKLQRGESCVPVVDCNVHVAKCKTGQNNNHAEEEPYSLNVLRGRVRGLSTQVEKIKSRWFRV
jgi:hypothetical protein